MEVLNGGRRVDFGLRSTAVGIFKISIRTCLVPQSFENQAFILGSYRLGRSSVSVTRENSEVVSMKRGRVRPGSAASSPSVSSNSSRSSAPLVPGRKGQTGSKTTKKVHFGGTVGTQQVDQRPCFKFFMNSIGAREPNGNKCPPCDSSCGFSHATVPVGNRERSALATKYFISRQHRDLLKRARKATV